MKTHATATYARKPGDKFRPVLLIRPTLRKIEVELRKLKRSRNVILAALQGRRKMTPPPADKAAALLADVTNRESRITNYVRSLAA